MCFEGKIVICQDTATICSVLSVMLDSHRLVSTRSRGPDLPITGSFSSRKLRESKNTKKSNGFDLRPYPKAIVLFNMATQTRFVLWTPIHKVIGWGSSPRFLSSLLLSSHVTRHGSSKIHSMSRADVRGDKDDIVAVLKTPRDPSVNVLYSDA